MGTGCEADRSGTIYKGCIEVAKNGARKGERFRRPGWGLLDRGVWEGAIQKNRAA